MRHSWIRLLAAAAVGILPARLAAQDSMPDSAAMAAFEATLGYTSGQVTLGDSLATLQVPAEWRFIGPEGSRRLLEDAWGNPEGSADGVLGMLVPSAVSPLADSGWAVVITYDEDGYVNDEDAGSIDFAELLEDMQESTEAENKERVKEGYDRVTLVGWAETPTYDSASHKLYWAKELAFGGAPNHTLNYNVRVLGRRGVLVLNAVSGMPQLAMVKQDMQTVIGFVNFNEGHRYTDFVEGKDKVAAYGIAGIVAGTLAAKAGFFKVILAALVAAKKLLIAGAVALFVWLKRFFAGRGKAQKAA